MAIELVNSPTAGIPASTADYNAQNVLIQSLIYQYMSNALHLTQWDTLVEPELAKYVYIQHGGALFQVRDSNYSIGGAPANGRVYIKVERSGDELTAEFVNSAVGYSWNVVYNGFYHADGSQLLPYILYKTASGYTKFTLKDSVNKFNITADLIYHNVLEIGGWNMNRSAGGDANKNIPWDEITAFVLDSIGAPYHGEKVAILEIQIIPDTLTNPYDSNYQLTTNNSLSFYITTAWPWLNVSAGGTFDSVTYNDDTINRGYIHYLVYI